MIHFQEFLRYILLVYQCSHRCASQIYDYILLTRLIHALGKDRDEYTNHIIWMQMCHLCVVVGQK